MAEDISSLGIEVDSSQIERANRALDESIGVAGRVAGAYDSIASAATNAAAVAGRIGQTIGAGFQTAGAAAQRAGAGAAQALNMMGQAGSAAAQNMGAAAQRASQTLGQVGTAAASATTQVNTLWTSIRSGTQGLLSATQNMLSFGNAANTAATNVTRLNVAANQNIGAVQAGRYHTANLAMQFQDIGVQAATATSPLQIALQQGTQISAIFSGMGASAAMKTFAGAVASVISPLSLFIILMVGVTAGAAQMVDWIELMKDGLRALADIMPQVTVAAAIMGTTLAIAFAPAIIGTVVSLVSAVVKLTASMLGLAAASAIANPFAAFILGVGAAVTAIYLFRDEFVRIFGEETLNSLRMWGNSVIAVAVTAFETTVEVWDRFPALFENIFNRALNAAIGKVNEWINAIIDMYNDFVGNLNTLWKGAFPEIPTLPNVKPAFVEGSEAAQDLDAIIDGIWEKNRNRDWIGEIGGALGRGAEWAAKKLRELADSLGEGKTDKAIKKAKEYIQNQLEAIEKLQTEIALVGESKIAREKALEILKAEQKIRELGIALYGKEANEIRKNARAIAELTEALAKAQFMEDAAFRRRQLMRSPGDQQIASELRSAGFSDNLNSAEAQILRQIQQVERLKETWQEVFDTVNDGIDNFVDALFDGTKDIGEVLKQLGRDLARLFFDLAITNPLKNWLTGAELPNIADLGIFKSGASSGRGGGFGGMLGKLFGAQQAVASMSVSAGTVVVNGAVTGLPGLSNMLSGLGPATNTTLPGGLPRSLGGAGPFSAGTLDTEGSIGGAGKAVDLAMGLLGQSENRPLNINSFLAAGGMDINAAQTAWCAAFVNSSLEQIGIKGNGSLVATDFLKWGKGVDLSQVMKGDVLVEARGLSAGQTGGHVGLATGATRMGRSGLEVEMLSGNTGGEGLGTGGVGLDWMKASQVVARRAADLSGTIASAASNMVDISKYVTESFNGIAVSGLQVSQSFLTAAGGAQQFGQMLSSFLSGGGGASGWFQSLVGSMGGLQGAVSHITSFGPQATRALLTGGGGLYHSGGIAGYGVSQKSDDNLAPDEMRAVLRRGEPVFRSWEHAKDTFANSNNQSSPDPVALAKEMAKYMKLSPKIVNVMNPSIVGDYLRSEEGQDVLMNELRRNNNPSPRI